MSFLFNAEAFETFSAAHAIGLQYAKTFGLFGAGFSIGRNFMRVMNARIRSGVALANIIRDTIISFIVGYAGSSLIGGIVNSSVGTTASSTLGITPSTLPSGNDVNAAGGDLIFAADKLVGSVTGGLNGLMSAAGVENVVPTISSGGALGIVGPSLMLVLVGAIIGCVVSLIFER